MPSTEYNVSMIRRRCPNESPEAVIDILNEIQTIVYSQDCRQNQYIDSATGLPPYIATTDSVFTYDCPVNCRRTAAILTLDPQRRYNRERPAGPRQEYFFRNNEYYKVAADSRDATPDEVAKVYFQENPGATTNKYLHLYYIKPTPLCDITQQLLLPEEVHYKLRKGVIAFITGDEYGNSAYDEQMIESIAKDIRKILNRGMDATAGTTPLQMCDREYDEIGYGHR